jgi:hypothetical protein
MNARLAKPIPSDLVYSPARLDTSQTLAAARQFFSP